MSLLSKFLFSLTLALFLFSCQDEFISTPIPELEANDCVFNDCLTKDLAILKNEDDDKKLKLNPSQLQYVQSQYNKYWSENGHHHNLVFQHFGFPAWNSMSVLDKDESGGEVIIPFGKADSDKVLAILWLSYKNDSETKFKFITRNMISRFKPENDVLKTQDNKLTQLSREYVISAFMEAEQRMYPDVHNFDLVKLYPFSDESEKSLVLRKGCVYIFTLTQRCWFVFGGTRLIEQTCDDKVDRELVGCDLGANNGYGEFDGGGGGGYYGNNTGGGSTNSGDCSEDTIECALSSLDDGEDRIVNSIDPSKYPCASDMVNVLVDQKGALGKIINDIFGVTDLVNLRFSVDASLSSNIAGTTSSVMGSPEGIIAYEIKLNPGYGNFCTKEGIYSTIVHEAIHAVLKYYNKKLSFSEFSERFPGMRAMLNTQSEDYINYRDHEIMGTEYLSELTLQIRGLNPNLGDEIARNLAWVGLQGTQVYRENADPQKVLEAQEAAKCNSDFTNLTSNFLKCN